MHTLIFTTANNNNFQQQANSIDYDSINENNIQTNLKKSDSENGAENGGLIKPEPIYEPLLGSEDSSPLKLLSALLSAKTPVNDILASPKKWDF